jgi:PAS domain S-box-containing protein/diguanylate cyclase (GGDEF)-like protein
VAVRTSLWYAFFAALWIVLSGGVLAVFVHDPQTVVKVEIYKGWVFVTVTAFLLYGTLFRQMRWLEKEVDARDQAEQLTRESQERFSTIFRMSPVGITLSRIEDGRLVDANPAFLGMVGYSRGECIGHTSSEVGVWDQEDRHGLVETMRTRHKVRGYEFQYRKKSGERGIMLGSAEVIQLAGESHLLGMMLDITDRKRTEEALKESESRFRGAFDAASIGMALVALDGHWLEVNQALCESVGYSEAELLEKSFQDITHPDDLEKDLEHLKKLVDDEIPYYQIEKRFYHRDGYVVWVLLSVSMVRDSRGYPLYFVSQIEDITERKFLEEKLQTALITDELTGLYNRRGFFELTTERLWSAPRDDETATLVLVKLDDMKLINDRLGHEEGDRIIAAVGSMLQETFQDRGVVGRIGGVEFAVLAIGVEETINGLIGQLERSITKFINPARPISMGIGIACSEPGEPRSLERLIARADEGMHQEKQRPARVQVSGGTLTSTFAFPDNKPLLPGNRP